MCTNPTRRRLETVIEIEHLHKRYGDVVAVEDVSLTVEPNEIFGIIGTNGAGKTTTVECLTGVRKPGRRPDQRARLRPGHAARRDPRAGSASSCRRARSPTA